MKIIPGVTIFVWVSYGNIEVYSIDSDEDRIKLLKTIQGVCSGLDSSIDFSANSSIINCIEAIGGVGCHETFENGTGWSRLHKPS